MFLPLLVFILSMVASVETNTWCYSKCDETPSFWSTLDGSYCGGNYQYQSPVDISTASVVTDHNLHDFTFEGFDSPQAINSIENNGHTVMCSLKGDVVKVSGGGLNGTYHPSQFHFHWGQEDSETHPGSEHLVDGHRYTMEMHIVSVKEGLTEEGALQREDGYAVLGFFINATDDTNSSESWTTLTSYLQYIKNESTVANMTQNITINDLIGFVNLSMYYRYMGSLTTPNCNQAVVWTLFQQPINVNRELLKTFPSNTDLTDTYRPTQPLNERKVYASPSTLLPGHSWCYEGHACDHVPSHWGLLPDSKCDGEQQSPINIDTKHATEDESLGAFTFTNFDDKHAIVNVTNTGHSVKCILKDGVVEVSGGGLSHVYSVLQFHFHWGTAAADSEGSEHLLDSKRYPMEMHIVSKRKDLSLEDALKEQDGLAVLGFLIEVSQSSRSSSHTTTPTETHETTDPITSPPSEMGAWKKLTNYLERVKNINSMVEFTDELSIDDLLGGVDRHSYFRYSGSLTTPSCNEAVVWTVFKESVKVDHELMAMFPEHTGFHNVYRPRQEIHSRTVRTTKASAAGLLPVWALHALLLLLCALLH